MKKINAYSKRGKQFLEDYWSSSNTDLRQCYKRMSWEKEHAEYECRRKMTEEGGTAFKILSYNKFSFTCGWLVGTSLRIETAYNSYKIPNIIFPF